VLSDAGVVRIAPLDNALTRVLTLTGMIGKKTASESLTWHASLQTSIDLRSGGERVAAKESPRKTKTNTYTHTH
jgi:hypothetical protein